MKINCERCEMRGPGCRDCVITVQPQTAAGHATAPSGRLAEEPGPLTEEELKALAVLADAGLVPPLRLSLPGSARSGSAVLPGARAWVRRVVPETKAS